MTAVGLFSVAGCSSFLQQGTGAVAGVGGAAIAAGVTSDAAVATGIGVGVQSLAQAGVQRWQRVVHTAEQDRIAITGRSYGGYLTLAGMAFYPGYFACGVDICGMSDLHTFYRDTEPWIAEAAKSKYGDPVADAGLVAAISPLHRADNITEPLLVVHGELDTNVPIGEAHQIVAALRELGRPVQYLQLDGEGHEYRRADSRTLLITTMLEFLTGALQVDGQGRHSSVAPPCRSRSIS